MSIAERAAATHRELQQVWVTEGEDAVWSRLWRTDRETLCELLMLHTAPLPR